VPPLPPSAAEIALSTAAASASGTAETDASVPATPKSAATPKSTSGKADRTVDEVKPFQRLQFLVRDWQNFDTDYEDGQDPAVFDALHEGMQKYLTDVLRSRGLWDLQSTRDQITRCFE
jgi:hypothetical protein